LNTVSEKGDCLLGAMELMESQEMSCQQVQNGRLEAEDYETMIEEVNRKFCPILGICDTKRRILTAKRENMLNVLRVLKYCMPLKCQRRFWTAQRLRWKKKLYLTKRLLRRLSWLGIWQKET
jgi:hypothetical protein